MCVLCLVLFVLFSNDRQKVDLLSEILDQLSNFNMGLVFIETFDWYLFQVVVLLKPDCNCCNSFALSWVHKVTTGTWSFVSIIGNVVAFFVIRYHTFLRPS